MLGLCCRIWIVLNFLWILEWMSMACFFFFFPMLVFWQKKYKKIFLCVPYGQYPNMFFNVFLYIKKQIFKVLENVFSYGFLKHNTKIIFLHLGFYNMFVNSKGCWPIFQKYKNLIFENSSLFTINVWIKKPQNDLIFKILLGIIRHCSLLIFR
jgi:hypothetical protein